MSFATDKWFKHIREEILIEGLNDIGLTEDDVNRILNLPNIDMMYSDAEVIKSKPRMPAQKKQKISRHSHAPGSKGI